jgi:microcystin-dependent protein
VSAGTTIASNQLVILYSQIVGIILSGNNCRVENVHVKNAACSAYEAPIGVCFGARGSAVQNGNLCRGVRVDNIWGIWGCALESAGNNFDAGHSATISAIFEDCIVVGNGLTQQGLSVLGSKNTMFMNNVVSKCTAGFYTDTGYSDGLILSGNIFDGFPVTPFGSSEVAAIKIGGGYSWQNVKINSNIIRLPATTAGITAIGIYLWQGVNNATVQDNIITGTSGKGLQIDSSATAVLISDNLISSSLSNNGWDSNPAPGVVMDYAGSTAPDGWLMCYGQSISRTTYYRLFAAIGVTYGAGDGSTTFNLPDCRGRVTAGKDNMGGTAAGRLTNSGAGNPGIDGAALGANGGADRIPLAATQIPSHTHSFSQYTFSTATNTANTGNAPRLVSYGFGTSNTAATGGGQEHPNAQPTIIFQKIIKT